MRVRLAAVLIPVAAAFACESGSPSATREPPAREAPRNQPKAPAEGKKLYGAPISNGASAELAEVLASPERFKGQNLVVSGHVRRACTRMGCWMEIASGTDPTTPACRVFFHGHGFFVPKDSAGSEARVEGRVEVITVSAEHAAHLEEEGGRVAGKRDDGTALEVRLVASGVELYRRGG